MHDRYENKRVIVDTHVMSIINQPTLQKESTGELRQSLDTSIKHLLSLEALGVPVEAWNNLLISVLAAKLDPVTVRDWESSDTVKGDSELPMMTEFTNFLRSKCESLERLDKNSSQTKLAKKQKASSNVAGTKGGLKCYYVKNHTIQFCIWMIPIR